MKIIQGDILTPNKENMGVLVCHQVNCRGFMGAGLAKQVRRTFPSVFKQYKDKCREIQVGFGGLGDVQFCPVIEDAGYILVNVFGQYDCGREKQYTDYAALKAAFERIADVYPSYTVRIPYQMGCGLGGGDWAEVSQIIENTLVSKGIDVEIWRLP